PEPPRTRRGDYDRSPISEGRRVYSPAPTAIPPRAQVRAALGLPGPADGGAAALAPPDLPRALLRPPVRRLANGGLGPYPRP
ncbi:NAD-glutamate dehydrogenase, partial [Mycobacterium tuberculosis]|nr:NAD-glutamate dehydrogenase [Mycobacterium tuberculosis]